MWKPPQCGRLTASGEHVLSAGQQTGLRSRPRLVGGLVVVDISYACVVEQGLGAPQVLLIAGIVLAGGVSDST